ncbi:MAG: PAN domain-containing protein [Desulfosporosinus sp.]|nr:PAN domain-containing protein [Desulfosporosinus sp.]
MKKSNIGIIVGGALLVATGVAVIGYVAYTESRPKPKPNPPLSSEYDMFTGYRVEDPPFATTATSCKNKCSENKDCLAASYNFADKTCTTTTKDPFTNASETTTGDWQIFIRRPLNVGPSTWSPWNPATCGTECGTGAVLKRTCMGAGKCLGASELQCKDRPCYDMFDEFVIV